MLTFLPRVVGIAAYVAAVGLLSVGSSWEVRKDVRWLVTNVAG